MLTSWAQTCWKCPDVDKFLGHGLKTVKTSKNYLRQLYNKVILVDNIFIDILTDLCDDISLISCIKSLFRCTKS